MAHGTLRRESESCGREWCVAQSVLRRPEFYIYSHIFTVYTIYVMPQCTDLLWNIHIPILHIPYRVYCGWLL